MDENSPSLGDHRVLNTFAKLDQRQWRRSSCRQSPTTIALATVHLLKNAQAVGHGGIIHRRPMCYVVKCLTHANTIVIFVIPFLAAKYPSRAADQTENGGADGS
jgi:hypothetical protein